jgi:GGDEF domain-containing protein
MYPDHVQSIRDPLTDLFNRRYMEESLEQELRLARNCTWP